MKNEEDPFICDQWESRTDEADVQRSDKCCRGEEGREGVVVTTLTGGNILMEP